MQFDCPVPRGIDIAWVLMYADDIALTTEPETQMNAAIEVVHHIFEQWELEFSEEKTKVVSTGHASMAPVQLHRGSIEPVDQFKYLCSISAHDMSMQPELTQRLCKAGQACHRLLQLWKDKHLAGSVKLLVYKSFMLATLLYSCEAWAVLQFYKDPWQLFHKRCLRKICVISFRQRQRMKIT